MADNVFHDPVTGDIYRWDPVQEALVPATPVESEIARAGALGQAQSAFQGATGLPGLFDPEYGAALEAMNPGTADTAFYGSLATGVGGLAKAGVTGISRKASGRMADRIAARVRGEGGSMIRTESGLIKRPADIAPGALQGTARAIESGFEAIPGMRLIGDAIKLQRNRKVNEAVGEVMGLRPEQLVGANRKITREVFDDALRPVDEAYTSARSSISQNVDEAQMRRILDDEAVQRELTELALSDFSDTSVPLGDRLLDLRSELRALQRTADTNRQRGRLNEIIDNIQQIIKDAVPAEVKANLDEADRIYKFWKAIDNSSAINPEGFVNASSMARSLRKQYGSRATMGGKGVSDPAVERLVKLLDEAGQLGNPLPSSGTAERAIAAGIVAETLGITNVTGR